MKAIQSTDSLRPSRRSTPAGERSRPVSITERRLLLATVDGAGSLIGVALAATVTGRLGVPWLWLVTTCPIWMAALALMNGYALRIPSSRSLSVIAVLKATPIVFLVSALVYWFQSPTASRLPLVEAVGLSSAMVILVRLTVARLILHQSLAARVVLLGDELSEELERALAAARFERQVVGRIRTDLMRQGQGEAVANLHALFQEQAIDEVILSSTNPECAADVIEACVNEGVRVIPASRLSEEYLGRVSIQSLDSNWFLSLPNDDLLERPYSIVRRLMDICLSILISIPLLALLPALTILIKVESPGPIFLVQRRAGLLGRPFGLLKLRTMKFDAEARGPQLAVKDDSRVTKVGRLLRMSRLDELPQALNILRGEMSFIGPRPERPELLEYLEARIPHFRARLLVKPGLTGWAQTQGGYAATIDQMTAKLEYDLYYIKNRSLRLDLQILASTLEAVVGLKGV